MALQYFTQPQIDNILDKANMAASNNNRVCLKPITVQLLIQEIQYWRKLADQRLKHLIKQPKKKK